MAEQEWQKAADKSRGEAEKEKKNKKEKRADRGRRKDSSSSESSSRASSASSSGSLFRSSSVRGQSETGLEKGAWENQKVLAYFNR
jgi:hypothetical protein